MSTTLETKKAKAAAAPPPAAPAPAPALPDTAVPAVTPDRPSDAWAGDRIALAVWLFGALLMAFLLLKDLLYGLLFR
jgi:hypothetical protein